MAPNLIEHEHYICVKEEIWTKLVALYSGGPSLQRIYPRIYDNTVIQARVNSNGCFSPDPVKKSSTLKQLVYDYAGTHEKNYVPFYKPAGRNEWKKIRDRQATSEEVFSAPRTYLVFVPLRFV